MTDANTDQQQDSETTDKVLFFLADQHIGSTKPLHERSQSAKQCQIPPIRGTICPKICPKGSPHE
jgi:hypothetical protein